MGIIISIKMILIYKVKLKLGEPWCLRALVAENRVINEGSACLDGD